MSNNYNSTLQSNNTDLQAILNTINELPEAGGEQATPVISINSSNGLITATAGTKTSTHQLAFQAAKTIRPSTTNQIAVSSGYYTGGNITVQGDTNLVAGNIKSGVSIFGVSGTYAGSSGNTSTEDGLITRTISNYTNNRITAIGNYAFAACSSLTSVNFPKVTTVGNSAFYSCSRLTSVKLSAATTIGSYAFGSCSNLVSVSFPAATTIGNHAFIWCHSLTSVNFPKATTIGNYAFNYCSSLASASFPAVTTIGNHAFAACSSITSVNFPKATTISNDAFHNCSRLTSVSFPMAATIGSYAFCYCSYLTSVSFPMAASIGSSAFYNCSRLTSIYLKNSSVCYLAKSNAFSYTGIWSNKGSIFVPSSLVTSYKTATNWTFFSNRIYGV